MIAGIAIAVVAGVLLLAVCIYIGFYRKRKVKKTTLLPAEEHSILYGDGTCFLFFSPSICLFGFIRK